MSDWWAHVGAGVGERARLGGVGVDQLEELIDQPLDDDRLSDLIWHMGLAFKPEMTQRSTFTSELFPMAPYICLSLIEDFHMHAERAARIEEAKAAQEIGRDNRHAPGLISPLWIWMAGYHFLCGREMLIGMGSMGPGDHLEEVRTVIDFWRRLTLAHRGDGTLDNGDAGKTNRYLPAEAVGALVAATEPLDGEAPTALRRLSATLSGYCFLLYTDSRVGICDHGPYRLEDGRELLVRDFFMLGFGPFPWAEGVDLTFPRLTLALVFEPDRLDSFEINDWGTTFAEPEPFLDAVRAAAVVGHAPEGDRHVPAEEWGELTVEVSKAHTVLYQRFAEMERRELIMSATRMYAWGLMPFADDAGVTGDIDWEISQRTLELYPDPLDDDETAGGIFAGAVVAHDRPSSFSRLD